LESSLLADVNTYDIVNAEILVITESAAKMFVEEEEEATA
jgi:large subunit ribosomal protein L4